MYSSSCLLLVRATGWIPFDQAKPFCSARCNFCNLWTTQLLPSNFSFSFSRLESKKSPSNFSLRGTFYSSGQAVARNEKTRSKQDKKKKIKRQKRLKHSENANRKFMTGDFLHRFITIIMIIMSARMTPKLIKLEERIDDRSGLFPRWNRPWTWSIHALDWLQA